jgi:hypothetical protein
MEIRDEAFFRSHDVERGSAVWFVDRSGVSARQARSTARARRVGECGETVQSSMRRLLREELSRVFEVQEMPGEIFYGVKAQCCVAERWPCDRFAEAFDVTAKPKRFGLDLIDFEGPHPKS